MQYQSIIRFFDYSGIEYDSAAEFNLSRAKKLIAAEFAMQADGIIIVDNCSYIKQYILSELERADFMERLQFHKIVWAHKNLLSFLEQDTFDFNNTGNWYALSNTPGFTAFISPYFSVVYNRAMRSLLNKNDLSAAANWLDYLRFVEPEDEEEALRNTRLYLNEAVRFFRNLNDASFKSRDKELRLWYTTSWSNFINNLPDSLLSYVDEIVSAIINFTVRIQKSGKKICYNISKELLKVNNANYSLIQLIRSNHEAYTQNYKGKTFSGWLKSGVNIVYVIMIAIFAISKLFLNNSDDGDSSTTTFVENGLRNEDLELKAYNAARASYRSYYSDSVDKPLGSISRFFDARETYILIEAPIGTLKSSSKFGIRNNTSDTLEFRTLRAGYISHFSMAPTQYYTFKALHGQSMDMFCEFGNTNVDAPILFNTTDMHFLHVGYSQQVHSAAYSFNDNILTEMPYLDKTEFNELPLIIDISKSGGKYYFRVKGGDILLQKGTDR